MSIEARSRNSNSTRPIVIIVALLVSEIPKLILSKSSVVANDLELGSSNSSTGNVLGNKEILVLIRDNSV